ncbi:MAG: AAA family ATPase [Candidatus Omnitrophica bacterium]|nr:AAA family ATPase [Candidatus Omnitrophota bacterium]
MSYYEALGLKKEPFSTSPDPDFLYRSSAHESVLKRLEIAIRLKRGMSLVFGDVGMGKTTLSRVLLQEFMNDTGVIFHMILDPDYNSEFQFLEKLVKMFGITPNARTTHDYKEEIEKYLFRKGVDENKTVILLIDEGQKLTAGFLEILRTFLNYETNDYKLLQLVILSQLELLNKVKRVKNFYDRVAFRYIVNPLDEVETKEMIGFRLRQAGLPDDKTLFSEESIGLIHEHSRGYPRRIAMLCHDALEELIIEDKDVVDGSIAEKVIRREEI